MLWLSHNLLFFCCEFLFIYTICPCTSETQYAVDVDVTKVISTTEPEYLSYTLDFANYGPLNFSHPRLLTLARGLSPAILRFGGGSCDFAIFHNTTSAEEQQEIEALNRLSVDPTWQYGSIIAIFPQLLDSLYRLARTSNGRLLYDFNIQLRYGPQWDATNTREIMQYFVDQGYAAHIDFELGNEPPYKKFGDKAFKATGERIALDFLIFKRLLTGFPAFNGSRLVGPDVETPRDGNYNDEHSYIMRDFATNIKHNVSAITAHHYYFTGPTAKLPQFYDLQYFEYLQSTLPKLRDAVFKRVGGAIDLWLGESADSNQGGTPTITNSYASGFLWLDKLGIAALNRFQMVFRQDLYGSTYPLMSAQYNPNPDYWLSYVYKRLVGQKVYSVTVSLSGYMSRAKSAKLLRLYAHSVAAWSGYSNNSIVMYGVNLDTHNTAVVRLSTAALQHVTHIDVYAMTPPNKNLTATEVQLNGRTLRLLDDHTLPQLNPVTTPTNETLSLPPLTFAFFVLVKA